MVPERSAAGPAVAARLRAELERNNAKLGSAVFTPRTGAEYARFFDGLSLVEPGLVVMPQWRPDPDTGSAEVLPMYAAMGRKP